MSFDIVNNTSLPLIHMESIVSTNSRANLLLTLCPLHTAQQEVYYNQITHIHSLHYNVGVYIKVKG